MLPAIALIRGYQRQWLSTDLVAGLVVFAVTVPAALAYGELAGVDPVVGLHTSLIAMLAYFLFGTSRQLVLGAEATVAVLVATTVATLAPGASPERYLALTGALALLAGGFCILGGLLKFGFIADFLPRQVITGYMNGVALVIIASQAGKLLGIKLEHSAFFPRLAELFGKLGTVHWPTFGLGVLCVLILQLLKWSKSRIPGPIVVVVLATVAVAVWKLQRHSIAIVGDISSDLPHLHLPALSLSDVWIFWPAALSIALVAYADTILSGRALAAKDHYAVDANKELIALGVANASIGLFGGFPAGTSQSRTSVNLSSGGRSQLAGLVAAALIVVFLLFFTSALQTLPVVTLASIILVAGAGLIEYTEVKRFFHVRTVGGIGSLITTLGVLLLGVLPGILLSLVCAIIVVLYKLARPIDTIVPSRIPGLIVYRFEGPVFFLNASHFAARVRAAVAAADHRPRTVLIDGAAILDIDLTAAETIEQLQQDLRGQGVVLAAAGLRPSVRALLDRSGVTEKIGASLLYDSLPAAESALS